MDTLASSINYQNRPALQLAYLDITERKQAEEELRVSRDRFKTIFARAGMGIVVANMAGCIDDCKAAFSESELGGLAVSRFLILDLVHYSWIASAIGVIFILVGMAIYIIALISYRQTLKGIPTDEKGLVTFSSHHLYLLVGALSLSAILSLFLALRGL